MSTVQYNRAQMRAAQLVEKSDQLVEGRWKPPRGRSKKDAIPVDNPSPSAQRIFFVKPDSSLRSEPIMSPATAQASTVPIVDMPKNPIRRLPSKRPFFIPR
jgi:hypothetical protein